VRASRPILTLSLLITLPLAACDGLFGLGEDGMLLGMEQVTLEDLDGLDVTVRPAPIEGLAGRPFGVRVASNGTIFVTHQDVAQVTMIRSSGQRGSADVGIDPGDVVVTADGDLAIVSTFVGGDLHFIDAATGGQSDVTDIGSNAYRLALSSSGATVFVTTVSGMVHAVDVSTGNKVDSVQLSGSIQGIARRDANVIAVSSTGGDVTLLDAATLDVITSRDIGYGNQDIAFSADRSKLFVAQEGAQRIMVLSATTLVPVDTIALLKSDQDTEFFPFGMALGPDGRSLVVTSSLNGGIALVDARSMKVVRKITVNGVPRRVTFKRDGKLAYVANENGTINVIR